MQRLRPLRLQPPLQQLHQQLHLPHQSLCLFRRLRLPHQRLLQSLKAHLLRLRAKTTPNIKR
jgi:hypothetical protein